MSNCILDKSKLLLDIRNLRVSFEQRGRYTQVLHGLNIQISAGEVVGMVGESGSGKSVTWLSILGLLGKRTLVEGVARLCEDDLIGMTDRQLSSIRGRKIAMIFQDPSSSLNPAQRIGHQISESLRLHRGLRGDVAHREALALLDQVEIPHSTLRIHAYPHELSGGMNQRVMIAMALAGRPELLIADEPTTALDATVQAQILQLLSSIGRHTGMAMVVISHDFGVIAEVCDRVSVMYAGTIVESISRQQLFTEAKHPYTLGLLAAMPTLDSTLHRLPAIPGSIPKAGSRALGCSFAPRCSFALAQCLQVTPPLRSLAVGHELACSRRLAA